MTRWIAKASAYWNDHIKTVTTRLEKQCTRSDAENQSGPPGGSTPFKNYLKRSFCLWKCRQYQQLQNEQNHMCAQQRLRSAWAFLQAGSEDWSDWVDVQANLSHCWAQMWFCWFCHAPSQIRGFGEKWEFLKTEMFTSDHFIRLGSQQLWEFEKG